MTGSASTPDDRRWSTALSIFPQVRKATTVREVTTPVRESAIALPIEEHVAEAGSDSGQAQDVDSTPMELSHSNRFVPEDVVETMSPLIIVPSPEIAHENFGDQYDAQSASSLRSDPSPVLKAVTSIVEEPKSGQGKENIEHILDASESS
ncbi:hypothetical protein V6N12_065133 [Hibiscus sabdariffa]|uniref:Uncharacterized protein n=1 Tax=Hibiscus sabdariffa TaxID=183260 RepID=A0ABR2G7V7_9ROSI